LLRSQVMAHGTLVLPDQDAKKYVDMIGKETAVQFEDMNARDAMMRRPYRKYVQRIEEMERILRFVFEEMGKLEGCEVKRNKISEFLKADADDVYKLDSLENELQSLYQTFVKIKDNNSKLVEECNQKMEQLMVAEAALSIFQDGEQAASTRKTSDEETFEASAKKPLIGKDDEGISRLGNLSGVLPKTDAARFERALWRASTGNVYAQFFPVEDKVIDPKTGAKVEKAVFVVYFQGGSGYLRGKIEKICHAVGANMCPWPGTAQQAQDECQKLKRVLEGQEKALAEATNYLQGEAKDLLAPHKANDSGNSKIEDWRLFCIKEKSIYAVLNLCEEHKTLLQVDVWYPKEDQKKIEALLAESNAGVQQPAKLWDKPVSKSVPPTYIRTNEYTEAFQDVINTYGIPKYQEANPALLTLVTFPFIFGMMYGDVGHGSMLLLTGLFLCWKAESIRFTMPAVFQARFMVLSMGIFATFAGFMYNDFFSLGLPIFDTRWVDLNGDGHYSPMNDVDIKNSYPEKRGPYPFGIDWMWEGASNELLYMNSLKMKLSVLFGVLQMIVGVLLRWSNAFHEKSMLDFICECLPMMVFMLCFFGWMDVMILYKWVHPVDTTPSIINSMICMAMGQEDKAPMWEGSVQLAQKLMLCTVLAVPVMLLPKPFVLLWQHNKAQEQKSKGDEETGSHGGGHGHGEEFEFGEVFIHQIIETIEYVLGTVSHTASYLRIWALSLAHQQLSQVFFDKTLKMGLTMPYPMNGIVIYLMFVAWFGITVGVLLGMDVLECFLHTLRLHWVEFQSKFYKSDGEKFMPYSVRTLLETAED